VYLLPERHAEEPSENHNLDQTFHRCVCAPLDPHTQNYDLNDLLGNPYEDVVVQRVTGLGKSISQTEPSHHLRGSSQQCERAWPLR
jgi:hypothetical protein